MQESKNARGRKAATSGPGFPRPRGEIKPIMRGQVTCSPAQAAAAAGVAISTVWLWLNGNRLASRSVGGRRLINVASLYRLIGADGPDDNQGEA